MLTVQEMGDFVGSILDTQDRAMAMLFAKTGVRRGELVSMDLGDINWEKGRVLLKPNPEHTNRLVFPNEEAAVDAGARRGRPISSVRASAARRRKAR